MGKTLTRKSNGEHGLRIQVPGLSYFSICRVLVLRRHTLRISGSRLCEEGCAPCASAAIPDVPKSDRRPVLAGETVFYFVRRRFRFGRSAALELPLLRHRVRSP